MRKLSSGAALDLRPMLQGVEGSSLAQLRTAIEKADPKAFEAAVPETITECYACHKLAEKPYLRPQIPDAGLKNDQHAPQRRLAAMMR